MRGDGKTENWRLIKEDDEAANRRANSEFLEGLSFSVTTGRSMEEIAGGKIAKRKTKSTAVPEAHAKSPESATAPESALKTAKRGNLIVGGITVTHPDRVISETGHVTKGELAEYYFAAAPFVLPHIARHPLSLLRCPSGIDGECFFQRNPGKGLGADVTPFEFRHKGKKCEYLFVDDEKGLVEVIQMGAIELHPWGAPVDAIDYPDRMIFDLDPSPDVGLEAVKLAALDLRQRLQRKGLESTLKCTGGKGLHVTVPLAGKDKWPAVKSFAGSLAEAMVAAVPETYVASMSKAKRTGKIFIDYFRNDYTATAIADYGVRARPGAPVALPLEWTELSSLKSASQFTMKDVLTRLRRTKAAAARIPKRAKDIFLVTRLAVGARSHGQDRRGSR
jgi:bifunctional non-homologous end joining protein LigD